MSLHNLNTTITPHEVAALFEVLQKSQADDTYKELAAGWIAAQKERLFTEWEMLPEGSHLKEAYSSFVWTWSDRDLEAMDAEVPEGLNFVRPTKPD